MGVIAGLAAAETAADTEPVGRRPDGRTVTPVGQVLTPLGRLVELPGLRPQTVALSPDGRILVTSGKTSEVVVIDPAGGEIRQRVRPPAEEITAPPPPDVDRNQKPDHRAIESYAGLVFSPDGSRLFLSNVHGSVKVFQVAEGVVTPSHTIPLPPAKAPGRAAEIPAGLAVSGDGTRVRVDPVRHVAAEGSVSIVDLATGEVRELLTGRHAGALAVAPDGRHVVCANAGDDVLSIISVATGEVVDRAWTKRTPAELHGAAPAALAFSPDGERLFCCNAAQNAVAILEWEPEEKGGTKLLGLIPVGWYPGSLVHDAARGQLAVANIKGLPPEPRQTGATKGFNTHHYHGSLSLVPIPAVGDLPAVSEIVARNLRAEAIAAARLPPRAGVAPRPIPERIGEPSLIEHVVYVIKENRTYDQVLGDLPAGRGHGPLCVFGERITPNQHALAKQFVLLDNTSCCGILSADGHNWSTSAIANEYLERSFAGFPRSYPDGMGDSEADALAWSPAGFIWDRAVEKGITIRNYGEFMMPRVRWKDPARKGSPGFTACHAAWRAGPEKAEVVFASEPAIESIRPFSPAGAVGWNMSVPDQVRADFVLAELAEYERRGEYPALTIICLPNDHTSGTSPGCPTPAACMADNDLAFGRIVEGLSKSRFWPKLVIVAIEDDPQAGWDHVSGYRTTCYLASPYAKRGVTVSTRYNTTSVLRTIGQILGLPPLNQFDAAASPMADCFTDEPDLTPFTALPANVPLDQMNPDPKAILDPVLRAGAIASVGMNFAEIDRAPEDALNRVLWYAVKGSDVPYPTWATSPEEDDDDDE